MLLLSRADLSTRSLHLTAVPQTQQTILTNLLLRRITGSNKACHKVVLLSLGERCESNILELTFSKTGTHKLPAKHRCTCPLQWRECGLGRFLKIPQSPNLCRSLRFIKHLQSSQKGPAVATLPEGLRLPPLKPVHTHSFNDLCCCVFPHK